VHDSRALCSVGCIAYAGSIDATFVYRVELNALLSVLRVRPRVSSGSVVGRRFLLPPAPAAAAAAAAAVPPRPSGQLIDRSRLLRPSDALRLLSTAC